MAATLTKAMLEDLMKGNSAIKLAPVGTLTASTFDAADEIFTVSDSLTITQEAPSKTEFKVTQLETAIAVDYEAGEFTIEGDIPSVARPLLEYFFNTTDKISGSTTIPLVGDYTSAVGISLERKEVEAMVMIESDSKMNTIIFTRCQFVANFNFDTTMNIHFTATVMTNPDGPELVVQTKRTASSSL